MKMKGIKLLLTAFLFTSLVQLSEQYYINQAKSLDRKAQKIVCQYYLTDKANGPHSLNQEPYLECANHMHLKIYKAELITTTPKLCPLQYTYENEEFQCYSNNYANKDATKVLQKLCDNKEECFFSWSSLPTLQCIEDDELYTIEHNNQALNITYECVGKRDRFHPFSNKRFDPKFSPNGFRMLRKLSYNRLSNLPGPGMTMPVSMPMPVPMPLMPQLPPMPQMSEPMAQSPYYGQAPPKQNYGPPQQNYGPPQQNYEQPPPPQNYEQPPPPQQNYVQPQAPMHIQEHPQMHPIQRIAHPMRHHQQLPSQHQMQY